MARLHGKLRGRHARPEAAFINVAVQHDLVDALQCGKVKGSPSKKADNGCIPPDHAGALLQLAG